MKELRGLGWFLAFLPKGDFAIIGKRVGKEEEEEWKGKLCLLVFNCLAKFWIFSKATALPLLLSSKDVANLISPFCAFNLPFQFWGRVGGLRYWRILHISGPRNVCWDETRILYIFKRVWKHGICRQPGAHRWWMHSFYSFLGAWIHLKWGLGWTVYSIKLDDRNFWPVLRTFPRPLVKLTPLYHAALCPLLASHKIQPIT